MMTTATATIKRGACAVCGNKGGSMVALRDAQGAPVTVHLPTHTEGGTVVRVEDSCQGVFLGRMKTETLRLQQEEKDNRLLESALRDREGKNSPGVGALVQSLEQSRSSRGNPLPVRGIFDCTVQGCPRFFDSEAGRDLHLKRGHK